MIWHKILYGALFVIVLPLLLVAWAVAAHHNVAMPLYGNTAAGALFAAAGMGLMIAATLELWILGGGLPMNAFPPPRLVTTGIYRYVPHPLYVGFTAVCFGVSMTAKSAAGLWLVTPSVLLGCVALVMGFEHIDLRRRFGRTLQLLPDDDETIPSAAERVRFLVLVVVPWIALYEFTINLPSEGHPFGFAFENRLPILLWAVPVYESVYIAVVLAPWCARTRRQLRQLMISSWMAMAIVFPLYWFAPSAAPRRPLVGHGWLAGLLGLERNSDPPVAAMPSFHVIWAVLVARLYRPRWAGAAYAVAVSISCVATGMHYVLDVIIALALIPVLFSPETLWESVRRAAERIANSWREWRIGPLRIINHSVYAGAAAFIQVVIVLAAAGPGREWKVLITAFAGLVGAAAWAQWIEGSTRLRRPFGFYGGLIGVGLACLLFPERWTLLAAHCLAAPWMQASGRLRCLINGCCHGSPTSAGIGIRVTHPRSRVTRLAELADVPIHATQLYSIVGNIVLGLLLLRLWISGCPLLVISGVYGIGSGVARFIEEGYRGEPQTANVLGLHLYQWIAAATVIVGAALTTIGSSRPPALNFSSEDLLIAACFSFIAGAALGFDFPESNRSFARLA